MKRSILLGLAGLLTITLATAGIPAWAEPSATVLHAGAANAVPGGYVVVLRDNGFTRADVASVSRDLAARYGGRVEHTYTAALRGFSIRADADRASRLAADPGVAYVQQNLVHRVAQAAGTQPNPPSWGLDRIDQRSLPLNASYSYPSNGAGVRVYVLDTGVRVTHRDFGGRAVHGRDIIGGDANASDCNGHGTHVAGTVAGTAFGVAKRATIVAVRVLDCGGFGTTVSIVGGVDWVTQNAVRPAVANMSLGGGPDTAIDNAVRNSITAGITYAIAAGNENGANACDRSPARVTQAITVGATTISDARASFSNVGSCVDLFAPGNDITSAWFDSDTATETIDGTSMATPHVAGVAAILLSRAPSLTPAQVQTALVGGATTGVVAGAGSAPNRLLFATDGPVVTLGCESLGTSILCSSGRLGGIAPFTTRWFVNDGHIPSWNNRSIVSIACVPRNQVRIRVQVIDARGFSDDERRTTTCPSGGRP